MSDSLSLTITLGCLLVALAAAFTGRRFTRALVVIEAAVLLQGLFAVVGLLRGHRPAELATFLAYLAFSPVVLPVAAMQVRGTTGRWSASVVAVALLVQAVLVVRLQTTWRTA